MSEDWITVIPIDALETMKELRDENERLRVLVAVLEDGQHPDWDYHYRLIQVSFSDRA